jgi:drug/metabolite transporter (DMT)-like permease
MNRRHALGALLIIIAAAMWGADGVVLRPMLMNLDVPTVVFLEHAIAFALMLIPLIVEWKELRKIKKSEWLSFGWIALFGGAIGTLAITKALFLVNFNGLSVVLILQKLQPVFAIALAALILKEKPQKSFYMLASIAIVGSYLVSFGFHKPSFFGSSLGLAALLSLLAAFSFGSCTTMGRKVLIKVNHRVSTYIRFGLTSLIMLAIISTSGFAGITKMTHANLLVILTIVFTSGAAAMFIYYYGLRRVTASESTIYELAFPVSAVALDYFLHGFLMNIGQVIGAILLVGSITILTLELNKGKA